MKKVTAVAVCVLFSMIQSAEFVQVKKTMNEKPSKMKEEIAQTLESLLTWSSDMIASIAQEQRLIVKKVHQLAQSEGSFAQSNPQALKRYRESLQKMEKDFEKQAQLIRMHFMQLEKDFLQV